MCGTHASLGIRVRDTQYPEKHAAIPATPRVSPGIVCPAHVSLGMRVSRTYITNAYNIMFYKS